MDFLKFLGAALVGGIVGYIALSQGTEIALGMIGFMVAMLGVQVERQLAVIARAMDANFEMLRHLQRMPSGEPFNTFR